MAQTLERSARDERVELKIPSEGWVGNGILPVPGSGRSFQAQEDEVLIVTLELKLSCPEVKGVALKCMLDARINGDYPKEERAEILRSGLIGYFEDTDLESMPDGKRFRHVWRLAAKPKEKWTIWLEVGLTSTRILPDPAVGYWLTRLGPPGKAPRRSRRVDDSELPR